MPDPQPPHLADALTRFRAAADAALERGHRAAAEARESGSSFDRETTQLAAKLRHRGLEPRGRELTSPDLRAVAAEFRHSAGLPVPDLPSEDDLLDDEPTKPSPPPEDEDFSQRRIMHKL